MSNPVKRAIYILGNALLTTLLVLGVFRFPQLHLELAQAGFTACPTGWTAAIELDPAATDSVGLGDDHMRCIRQMVRDRVETEMDFGELGNVSTDTGRLLEGGARCFAQDAAPTCDGTIGAACLAENDYDGNRGCDQARCWFDTNDSNRLYMADDTDADGDCDAWETVSAVQAALTASRAVVTDGSGLLAAATTTATEIGYVNGVTSALQTQLGFKAPLASPIFSGTITTPLTASRVTTTNAGSELAASTVTTTELALLSGQTSKAGRVWLATYSPAAAASVDITSVITTTYRFYTIKYSLVPSTDDTELYWRSDDANGASFDAGAADYGYMCADAFGIALGDALGAASLDQSLGNNVALVGGNVFVTAGIGNVATEGISGELHFDTVLKMSVSNFGYLQADAARYNTGTSTARRNGGGAINALQLIFGAGNATGFVQVYGEVQ